MAHLEGNFTPVLYMGRKVPKSYLAEFFRLVPPNDVRCDDEQFSRK